MSIRTLHTAEHNGLEINEIEIVDELGRRTNWDTWCPTCDEWIASLATEDEAFEVADRHEHAERAEV